MDWTGLDGQTRRLIHITIAKQGASPKHPPAVDSIAGGATYWY
jgi:hypothetical protein